MATENMRTLSRVKSWVVPDSHEPRAIRFGVFKGIVMQLCLQHQTQLYLGIFERETYGWLRRLSQGIATAVDIGAAAGEYTLFFLMKTNAAAVYAFEPDAQVLPALKNNLELNGMGSSKRLQLSSGFVGATGHDGVTCLDSLGPSLSFPCLIKMDVDGGELNVLEGAKTINAGPGVRWLIETHSKDLEKSCIHALEGLGFKTRIIKNAWWRLLLPEARAIEHNRWLVAWKEPF